ncbi:hypothetical protein [Atlantibacter subterraneus]|uniref:hypothetical protein n=1 Tax=Atlantibacter subterraneus TaxID=255519 RepID=UPI00289BC7F3|nr:hypothetical protein [Atlantibacter subterranea]
MKKIIFAIIAISISGCTTSAVTSDKAKPVPPDRIIGHSQGSSTLTITRDNGWLAGGGCFVEVTVDGKPYARVDTGETVKINIEPGRHILGISGDSLGKGLCGMQVGQPIKESSTVISADEIQKFRISGDTNSGLDIRPTTI